MKRIVVLLLMLSVALFADINTDTLEGINKSGSLFAGGFGIGAIHAIFWIPVVLFFLVASVIVGVYVKMFKQKDDGAAKVIASIAVGMVLGVIAYASSLSVVDGILDSDGCGSDVVGAYMKDSIKLGLSPTSYQFGTAIKAVGCLQ